MKYRKKPVVIEAITFDDLVLHGINSGAPVTNGMPWSFTYKGHGITHENDDCYLVPTHQGTVRFDRGDMLITQIDGEIYPCKPHIFAATYDLEVNPDESDRSAELVQTGKAEKTLHNSDVSGARQNVPDIKVVGNGDTFRLLCKASSKNEGWMKSCKAMQVPHGCVVQVTTQQGEQVAEALTFVPGVKIEDDQNGGRKLVSL